MTNDNVCKDCKGTGKYVGLNLIEGCNACGGTGIVNQSRTTTTPYSGAEDEIKVDITFSPFMYIPLEPDLPGSN